LPKIRHHKAVSQRRGASRAASAWTASFSNPLAAPGFALSTCVRLDRIGARDSRLRGDGKAKSADRRTRSAISSMLDLVSDALAEP